MNNKLRSGDLTSQKNHCGRKSEQIIKLRKNLTFSSEINSYREEGEHAVGFHVAEAASCPHTSCQT
jgi:hypothetical protein